MPSARMPAMAVFNCQDRWSEARRLCPRIGVTALSLRSREDDATRWVGAVVCIARIPLRGRFLRTT